MADSNNFPGHGYFGGTVYCDNLIIHGSNEIAAANLKHVHRYVYSQEFDTTPTSEDKVLAVMVATGTIIAFKAGVCGVETSTNSVSIDLHKNAKTAATVLSAPIVLDSSNTIYVAEAATIASPSVSAGDILVVTITDSSSDATGVFLFADVVESYD